MMTKASNRKTNKVEKMAGGAGHVLIQPITEGEELGAHCNMFSEVTLEAGCEIGYHEHHGETETYYITQGSGIYSDNGNEFPVEAGDVTFCKDGDAHGLTNTGSGNLVLTALILAK